MAQNIAQNMTQKLPLWRGTVVWLIFIVAESVNGTIRELWLIPSLGHVPGHQISFAIGSLLVLIVPFLCLPWLRVSRFSQLLSLGFLWLVLTTAFEMILGRWVLGYSWERIAADYNLQQGGLMPFGLLLLALSPLIAAKVRRSFGDRPQQPT